MKTVKTVTPLCELCVHLELEPTLASILLVHTVQNRAIIRTLVLHRTPDFHAYPTLENLVFATDKL